MPGVVAELLKESWGLMNTHMNHFRSSFSMPYVKNTAHGTQRRMHAHRAKPKKQDGWRAVFRASHFTQPSGHPEPNPSPHTGATSENPAYPKGKDKQHPSTHWNEAHSHTSQTDRYTNQREAPMRTQARSCDMGSSAPKPYRPQKRPSCRIALGPQPPHQGTHVGLKGYTVERIP